MKVNATMAFNEGYMAGYNQARADNGIITQEEADSVQRSANRYVKDVVPREKDWVQRMDAEICEMQRKKTLYNILKHPLKEMVNAYVQRGGIITLPREADCIGMVWTYEDLDEHIEKAEALVKAWVLTDSEKCAAIRGYEANLSFHDMAKTILAQRNVGLMREMMREIGQVCSKAFKRQMYPIEFYGKVEE